MQEMDLDELDQEVSKLMDQAGKGKPTQSADDDNATASSVKTDEPVAVTAAAPQEDSSFVPVRRVNLQVTPRKNGVAMDIVQAKPSQVQPPSAKAARVAPTLQPSKTVTPEPKPEPTKDEPVAEKEANKGEEKGKEKDLSDDTLASLDMQIDTKDKPKDLLSDPDHDVHKSVWPDPLEVHGFKEKDDKAKADKANEKMVDPSMDDGADKAPNMTHNASAVTPMGDQKDENKSAEEPTPEKEEKEHDSPFVPAKVEKRPLGAYNDTPKDEPKVEEPTVEDAPAEDTADKTEPASIAIQTPKELSPEVVAVESSEPQFTPPAPKLEDNETDMNHLRQMSIPQQYQGKDKKPSDKDRPIFDTKEYHPPLKPSATPARGSSKTGTVVTIILIVLMIAAAAVAYFVVTGGLDLSTLL